MKIKKKENNHFLKRLLLLLVLSLLLYNCNDDNEIVPPEKNSVSFERLENLTQLQNTIRELTNNKNEFVNRRTNKITSKFKVLEDKDVYVYK